AEVFAFAPVFNEEGSIQLVIREWVETLRQLGVPWTFLALDDGSTDATPLLLSELTKEFPQLQVIRQRNQGHGPNCTNGYHRALARGAKWILQIDSDGQCDPVYFMKLWNARNTGEVVLGFRTRREDGWSRLLISRILSLVVLFTTGVWVRDSNV